MAASQGNTQLVGEPFRVFHASGHLTEDALRSYFTTFGNVVDVHVPRDSNTGVSKRYGFTSFDAQAAVDAVLAKGQHEVGGVTFTVRLAIERAGERNSRAEQPQQTLVESHGHGPRMYVGGVPLSMPETSLRAHFECFGTVADIYFPRDRVTGDRKPFCFVTFDTPEAAANALAKSDRVVDGVALGAFNLAANRNDHYAGRGDAVVGSSLRGAAASRAVQSMHAAPFMPGFPGMTDPAAAAAFSAAAAAAMSMLGAGMPPPMYGAAPLPPYGAPPMAPPGMMMPMYPPYSSAVPVSQTPSGNVGASPSPLSYMPQPGMTLAALPGQPMPQSMPADPYAMMAPPRGGGSAGDGPVRGPDNRQHSNARAAPDQRDGRPPGGGGGGGRGRGRQ